VSNDSYNRPPQKYEIFRNASALLNAFRLNLNSGIIMKKTLLAAGAVLALSTSFTAGAAENDKPHTCLTGGTRVLTWWAATHPFWTADP
jgi:nucleoside-specific channel-forming protein